MFNLLLPGATLKALQNATLSRLVGSVKLPIGQLNSTSGKAIETAFNACTVDDTRTKLTKEDLAILLASQLLKRTKA